jgi:hypothetical protein
MFIWEVLGWFDICFIAAGSFLLGYRLKPAFLIITIGEMTWITKAVWFQQWDLAAICILFAIVAALNWYVWGKGDGNKKRPNGHAKSGGREENQPTEAAINGSPKKDSFVRRSP